MTCGLRKNPPDVSTRCKQAPVGEEYVHNGSMCRRCWNYENDPYIRALYDGVPEAERPKRPCVEVIIKRGSSSAMVDGALHIGADAPSTEPPTFFQKVASLTKAVVKWIGKGAPVTPPVLLAARERACEGGKDDDGNEILPCEHFDKRSGCKKCGCVLLAAKRAMADQKCPVGKW